jgi:hypothetical protein
MASACVGVEPPLWSGFNFATTGTTGIPASKAYARPVSTFLPGEPNAIKSRLLGEGDLTSRQFAVF